MQRKFIVACARGDGVRISYISSNLISGLNRDKWHKVRVTIDASKGTLVAALDEREPVETLLKGLDANPHYGISGDHNSVVLIGGKLSSLLCSV